MKTKPKHSDQKKLYYENEKKALQIKTMQNVKNLS